MPPAGADRGTGASHPGHDPWAGDPSRLLRVLRAASERLDATFTARFPDTVVRTVNVSNGVGWAAGRAAADLALFDVHGQLTAAGDLSLAESA